MEFITHRRLKHLNVVRFYTGFEDAAHVYSIMELCPNGTLGDLLHHRGTLAEPEVRYYMSQLLDALQFLKEENVIHRDLKPDNIMISANMKLQVGDFGLACSLKERGEVRQSLCGTPNYMAPEVFGDDGYSYEVDMWALGVIM